MSKYYAQIYEQRSPGQQYGFWDDSRRWSSQFSCREFACRDVNNQATSLSSMYVPFTVRVGGGDMRQRTEQEQLGMARFANILLPDYLTSVDDTSIWVDSLNGEDGCQIYPTKPVWSLMLYYVKYMSIRMGHNTTMDRVSNFLIKTRSLCFRGLPTQQLGTALFFYAYVTRADQLEQYKYLLEGCNGPGSSMVKIYNMEEPTKESIDFCSTLLDDWCQAYPDALRERIEEYAYGYARKYYMNVLLQDIYNRIYDGDGRFDGIDYGDDEW
jgi:hypothetical protein